MAPERAVELHGGALLRRSNMVAQAAPTGRTFARAWWLAISTALLAGTLWGVLCWLGDGAPSPYSGFFNLGGPWLLLAWLIGCWAGSNPRGALCGGLALAAGVLAYYAVYTSGITVGGQESRVYDPESRAWLLLAALSGPVFGAAGAWSRSAGRWLRIGGVTIVAAALLAEAAYYFQAQMIIHQGSPFFDPNEPPLLTLAGYVVPRHSGVFVLAAQAAASVALLPAVLRGWRELGLGLGALAALAGIGVLLVEIIYLVVRGY